MIDQDYLYHTTHGYCYFYAEGSCFYMVCLKEGKPCLQIYETDNAKESDFKGRDRVKDLNKFYKFLIRGVLTEYIVSTPSAEQIFLDMFEE